MAFRPMVRMKVSMGIALRVSIWTVPRAPRPTETRAMVSTSLASTMLTKSYLPSVAYCATTVAPRASISLLTSLMRRGFACSVLTPAAVTLVSRTYVATALPPAPILGARAYADVHAGSGGGRPAEGASASRGSSAAQGRVRSPSHRPGRARDQCIAARDREARRRGERPRQGSHRLPHHATRPRDLSLLAARRRRPHHLLARPRD